MFIRLTTTELISHLDHAPDFSKAPLLSFDIFDTLLIRTLPGEIVTRIVAGKLEKRLRRLGFEPVRSAEEARREAYRLNADVAKAQGLDPDCRLEQLIPDWIRLTAGREHPDFVALAQWLYQTELEAEARFTEPNLPLFQKLRELSGLGRRLVYTSDMYLGKAGIDALLTHHGFGDLFEEGFVSSDHLACKWSGNLYRLLIERLALRPEDIIHVGDNPYSDGRVPRRLGIRGVILTDTVPPQSSVGETPTGIDFASLCHRLDREPFSPDEAFGYESIGPVFCAFVHKVLEDSHQRGLDRLYFISRDGYIFMRLYERIAAAEPWKGSAPQPIYLFLSRAAIFPIARQCLRLSDFVTWVTARPGEETLTSCLRRYGLDDACFRAAHSLLPGMDFEAPLYPNDLDDPRLTPLFEDAFIRKRLQEAAAHARSGLDAYLRRMGLHQCKRVGLVDIGWTGGTQTLLAEIFSETPDFPELVGYYFALTKDAHGKEWARNHATGVFADQRRTPGFHAFSAFSFLHGLESVSPAPHGSLLAYETDGSPRLMGDEDPIRAAELANEAVVAAVQRGALRFASVYGMLAPLLGIQADQTLDEARFIAARLVRFPREDEARRILALQFSEGFGLQRARSIGGDAPDAEAPLRERFEALWRRHWRDASWGRGVMELYRLPLVGFAYSCGAALKLLRQAGSGEIPQEKERLGDEGVACGAPWIPDPDYLAFMAELEARVQRAENAESESGPAVLMRERPPLAPLSRRLELELARRLVNAAATLAGLPAYTNDSSVRFSLPPVRLAERIALKVGAIRRRLRKENSR